MWASDFGIETEIVPKKKPRFKKPAAAAPFVYSGKKTSSVTCEKVDDLVTHPKKIGEVKEWLEGAGTADMLLLTGPTGAAKTATLRALANELAISITEWINPSDNINIQPEDRELFDGDVYEHCEHSFSKTLDKFEEFVRRGSRYKSLFSARSRTIILVEDFPNYFVWKPSAFHAFLERYKMFAQFPIVFICTEDEKLNLTNDLFPNDVKTKFRIHNIKFNPVSTTAMTRLIKKQVGDTLGNDVINKIVIASNGDVRTALSALEFTLSSSNNKKSFSEPPPKRKKLHTNLQKPSPSVVPLKDLAIDFFHVIGRVLYPKKKETADANGRLFLHDVIGIAEHLKYSSVAILHENFLDTFSHLNDITNACEVFSDCDLFERAEFDLNDYSSLIAVIGVMAAKKHVKPGVFKPFSKSRWAAIKGNGTKQIHQTSGLTYRTHATDVEPYLKFIRSSGEPYSSSNSRRLSIAESFKTDCDDEQLVIEEFND